MKLVHVDLEKPIAIHRNCPTEWIIESPELFLKYVEQLQKQNQGEKGNFVLSKADTELNMKRDVELVLTPFSLDFADHRIQKRLFTELVKSAQNEEMFLETQRIIAELKKYIYQLEAVSGYELEQNEEIDLSALLKLMGSDRNRKRDGASGKINAIYQSYGRTSPKRTGDFGQYSILSERNTNKQTLPNGMLL